MGQTCAWGHSAIEAIEYVLFHVLSTMIRDKLQDKK